MDNALSTDEQTTTALFLAKKAAMQFDGSWQVVAIPPESMDNTAVLPMPLRDGTGHASCYPGGISMGFYLTRKAWNSSRRDAAVQLLTFLTREDSLRKLHNESTAGLLLETSHQLVQECTMISPLQDAMNQYARECWLLDCLPALAEGILSPEECWQKVIALDPFK